MTSDHPSATPGVLIVDDDVELCELLREYLRPHHFKIDCVHNGPDGLRRAIDGSSDLVVLDVMLPGLEGFELLRQLRKRSNVPVIMLTARAEGTDRLDGFRSGADDYLVKPFAAAELLERIKAVLRRARSAGPRRADPIVVGSLLVDAVAPGAIWRGRKIDLTPTEWAILELLVRNAGRSVSRDELCAILYQRTATPFDRALDVHVSHLRRKLDAVGCTMIHTVRGVGYLCREP